MQEEGAGWRAGEGAGMLPTDNTQLKYLEGDPWVLRPTVAQTVSEGGQLPALGSWVSGGRTTACPGRLSHRTRPRLHSPEHMGLALELPLTASVTFSKPFNLLASVSTSVKCK